MPAGPLDDPRLREVEECLNQARFEDAQRKLVALGSVRDLGAGVAYLTTRLLAQRGRLDSSAVAERLRDVLAEAPDFPEARNYLMAIGRGLPVDARGLAIDALGRAPTMSSQLGPLPPQPSEPEIYVPDSPIPEPPASLATRRAPRPSTLETPRVPPPAGYASARRPEAFLGTLEPPRSEMPTEPAPPMSEGLMLEPLRVEIEPGGTGRGVWDPVELDLASGRVEAALSALEKQANDVLDQLVARQMPRLETVAERAAEFLGGAPIVGHFPAFDLSPSSLARLDAALALFVRRPQRSPRYALSVLLSAYVGECVRRGSGGTWVGRLAEPDMASVERGASDAYAPWRMVQLAMTEGRPLGAGVASGPLSLRAPRLPLHPPTEPPTAWDPDPWPAFDLYRTIGRVVPGSVLGTWATRVAQQPLDRTLASLAAIDQYLELLSTSTAPDASGGWARRAAVLTGSYVGEVLCMQTGARWAENEDMPPGPLRYELVTLDGGAAYPVLWSLERVRGQGPRIAERVRALLV